MLQPVRAKWPMEPALILSPFPVVLSRWDSLPLPGFWVWLGGKEGRTNNQIVAEPGIKLVTLWSESRDLTSVRTILIIVWVPITMNKIPKFFFLNIFTPASGCSCYSGNLSFTVPTKYALSKKSIFHNRTLYKPLIHHFTNANFCSPQSSVGARQNVTEQHYFVPRGGLKLAKICISKMAYYWITVYFSPRRHFQWNTLQAVLAHLLNGRHRGTQW